jgi:hypothetical protein
MSGSAWGKVWGKAWGSAWGLIVARLPRMGRRRVRMQSATRLAVIVAGREAVAARSRRAAFILPKRLDDRRAVLAPIIRMAVALPLRQAVTVASVRHGFTVERRRQAIALPIRTARIVELRRTASVSPAIRKATP